MTMKATGMPFCHSLNTIKVYKRIAKNMEQILCFAFINNDLVTTLHPMEEESIPYSNSFQRSH